MRKIIEDIILRENELTLEQWQELNKRNNEVESGKAQFISKEQLLNYLKERRNHNNVSALE